MNPWVPDRELAGFECLEFELPDEPTYALEPERSLVATVVRRAAPRTARAVLFVHGWNDYFFQRHLADEMDAQGYDFYAIDLRRYGRSLRPKQLAGYVAALEDYYLELDLAVSLMRDEGHDEIVLMGHSTGGLLLSIYASERPGRFSALVLNSPWLELQAMSSMRSATQRMFSAASALLPTTPFPGTDNGFYRRSISALEDGEWTYNHNLKGDPAFLVRIGWLSAIMAAQGRVAAGLDIDCPVLVAVSERTDFRRKWDEALSKADIVLDVNAIAERAHCLGDLVVLVRIPDALHDLALSAPEVRARVFAEYGRFLRCYSIGTENPAE